MQRVTLRDKKNSKLSIGFIFLCVFTLNLSCKKETNMKVNAQDENALVIEKQDVLRVEPPNWWVGFKNSKLQLLVNHPNISEKTPEISYQGIFIENVHQADNPNYLFRLVLEWGKMNNIDFYP